MQCYFSLSLHNEGFCNSWCVIVAFWVGTHIARAPAAHIWNKVIKTAMLHKLEMETHHPFLLGLSIFLWTSANNICTETSNKKMWNCFLAEHLQYHLIETIKTWCYHFQFLLQKINKKNNALAHIVRSVQSTQRVSGRRDFIFWSLYPLQTHLF